jgi:hypothetical protein
MRPPVLNLLQHYPFQLHRRKAGQKERCGSYPIDAPQGDEPEPSGDTLAALFCVVKIAVNSWNGHGFGVDAKPTS